jgi:hypothetical protein
VKVLFLKGGFTSGGVMFLTVCALAEVGLQITADGFLVGAAEAIVGKLIKQNVNNIGVAIIFTLFCISKV